MSSNTFGSAITTNLRNLLSSIITFYAHYTAVLILLGISYRLLLEAWTFLVIVVTPGLVVLQSLFESVASFLPMVLIWVSEQIRLCLAVLVLTSVVSKVLIWRYPMFGSKKR
jgi:hypothetical protein